jgi:3-(3-hydroxy-phenyl)propionate hydroxylase
VDVQAKTFDYHDTPDRSAATPAHHPLVVVGAGPVGLTLAIDLAQRGQRVLLLDNDHRLSTGSRAICFAKRTLEIWDRLGVGQRMVDKGVSWSVGRVFFRDAEVYRFDLAPEAGHERPAFINLQQYYAEAFLVERAQQLPGLEIRWKNQVTALQQDDALVTLTVDTPDGAYRITADHVAACDGSRSPLRAMLGLESKGRVFHDRFLIADLKLDQALCRRCHRALVLVRPAVPPGQSVLLHRQPDNVWRIDFQLGWDADPEAEKQPERITPRVQHDARMAFGRDVPFTLEWASVYTFACLRMDRFRARPCALCRRRGAWRVALRRARRQFRRAGRRQPGLEARGWCCAAGRRDPARQLRRRARTRGRREPAELDPRHRLHHAQERDLAAVPRRRAGAGAHFPFARRLVNSGRLSVPATLDGLAA